MGRRGRDGGVDGFLAIDKPPGMTSHDVVARVRRSLGTSRVGHAGTLDPDATGVLLVGVGRATRLMRYMTALPKSYVGELVLGVATSTLDAAGEVTATYDMSGVGLDDVRAAAAGFEGDILQIPPMVSAIKVGGRRLHELAREGVEIDREPRPVTVHRLEVEPTEDPLVFELSVDCSSGTYIRSLAADIGQALGGGAHLRALRRTAIGSFRVEAACPLDALELRPMAEALAHLDTVEVDPVVAALVANGRALDGLPGAEGEGPWLVVDADGEVRAVYERSPDGGVRPDIVVPPRG